MSVKENFVERLKLAAQEVIDNAEDIVGEHDMMNEVEVTLTVRSFSDTYDPEIRVNRLFYSDNIRSYMLEDLDGGR